MPRILGVDIPNDRPAVISLTYLYGVGPQIARELCRRVGIDPQVRMREVTEEQVQKLASLLDNEYTVEGHLRRQRLQDIRHTGVISDPVDCEDTFDTAAVFITE